MIAYWRIKQFFLLAGDAALFYLALFLALLIRYQKNPLPELWSTHWPVFTPAVLLWTLIFFINGQYDLEKAKNNLAFYRSFLAALGINFLLTIGYFYAVNLPQITPKTILILLAALYLPLFVLWRAALQHWLSRGAAKIRLLFIDLTDEAMELIDSFIKEPQLGYETAAVICDPDNPLKEKLPPKVFVQPQLNNLLELIKDKKIDTLVLCRGLNPELEQLLYQSLFLRVTTVDIASFFEAITHRVPTSIISELWFLENLKESQKKVYNAVRQILDYCFGLLMGLICLLLLPLMAPLIYFQDRGPIFYKQKRVGRGGRVFTISKFRTMRQGAESNGAQFASPRDPRVTAFGRILRLIRLDELPQAWNILRGEMSFIGPRPERPEFVAELEAAMPFYNIRHLVKPGLTGWAQINYPYADSIQGNLIKLQYDLYYLKNRSILVDLIIVLKTIPVVAKWLGR